LLGNERKMAGKFLKLVETLSRKFNGGEKDEF
jgi:hypothetical protein